MKFADFLREDMRLVILRLLSESCSYTSNSSIIVSGLAMIGHKVSRDVVKTELCWLAEQGYVTTEVLDTIVIVHLTERGADVAEGRTVVAGIKRPSAS